MYFPRECFQLQGTMHSATEKGTHVDVPNKQYSTGTLLLDSFVDEFLSLALEWGRSAVVHAGRVGTVITSCADEKTRKGMSTSRLCESIQALGSST